MGYASDVYRLLNDHEIADADDDQLYFTNLFLDEYQSKVKLISLVSICVELVPNITDLPHCLQNLRLSFMIIPETIFPHPCVLVSVLLQ